MTKQNKNNRKRRPVLASKPLVGLGVAFYGKRYFNKSVKLEVVGSLKEIKPPYVVVANHSGFADVGALIMAAYPN